MKILQALKTTLSRKDGYLYHAGIKLLCRKPHLVLKLLRLYSAYMLTNRNPIRTLDIGITKDCQYDCPHCYPDRFYEEKRKPLSVSEIVGVVKEGAGLGIVQFNFQGGEPTIDLDRLERIVSGSNPWSSYISLSSNGFRHKIADLKRIYDMGVDKLALSLHSGISEEHDAFVGSEGSHQRVLECYENSKKVGIEATLAIVLSHDNIRSEGVSQVIDMCISKNIILDINVAMPAGRWSGVTQNLLDEADYKYIDDLNRKHPNIRRDLHAHLFRKGCPAAKEFLYINVYGEVLTCPFLHISLGNVRDSGLRVLQSKALDNKWFNYHHPKCLACEDTEFLDKYIYKTFQSDETPLDWDTVFSCDKR